MARHWHDSHFHDTHWHDSHWIGVEAVLFAFVEALQIGAMVEAIQIAAGRMEDD